MRLLVWMLLTTLCVALLFLLEYYLGDPEPEPRFLAALIIYGCSFVAYNISRIGDKP
jgi:hypothetical protein